MSFSDQVKVNLSKVGPGVFFSIFGAAILVHGISHPPTFSLREGPLPVGAPGSPGMSPVASGSAPQERAVMIAGSRQEVDSQLAQQTTRNEVIQHLRLMNRLEALARTDLTAADRNDLAIHGREIKLKLMRSVWDSRLGDAAQFEAWARDHGSGAPNSAARDFFNSK